MCVQICKDAAVTGGRSGTLTVHVTVSTWCAQCTALKQFRVVPHYCLPVALAFWRFFPLFSFVWGYWYCQSHLLRIIPRNGYHTTQILLDKGMGEGRGGECTHDHAGGGGGVGGGIVCL